MTMQHRRLTRLEDHYRPMDPKPVRIPDWMRAWIDPLCDEDLEVLEAGLEHRGAGGDPADLPPETRARFEALERSYGRYCAEHRP